MKEDINLLPPEVKSQRLWRLYLRRVSRLLWVATIVLATAGGCLLMLLMVYRSSLSDVQRVMAQAVDDSGTVDVEVREVNRFVNDFYSVMQEQPSFIVRMGELLQVVPGGVRFSSIAFQRKERILEIEGVAESVDVLVEMQKSLEELSWVESVEAPLQNFATEQRGRFSFTLKLANDDKI